MCNDRVSEWNRKQQDEFDKKVAAEHESRKAAVRTKGSLRDLDEKGEPLTAEEFQRQWKIWVDKLQMEGHVGVGEDESVETIIGTITPDPNVREEVVYCVRKQD